MMSRSSYLPLVVPGDGVGEELSYTGQLLLCRSQQWLLDYHEVKIKDLASSLTNSYQSQQLETLKTSRCHRLRLRLCLRLHLRRRRRRRCRRRHCSWPKKRRLPHPRRRHCSFSLAS